MKKIRAAYLRVSTRQQEFGSQRIDIEKKYPASEIDLWVEEKISGVYKKPKLEELIQKTLRTGDELIVYSLSRLSRSQKELLETLEDLQKRGIILKSVKEDIDLSTPTGKLLFGIISSIVSYEREMLLERQAAGIECAKLKGDVYLRTRTY